LSDAIADCSTALMLDETYTKALLKRARLQLEAENFDAAITDFEAALDKEPGLVGVCVFGV
jgi:DnaJ family protein C protein 7